MLGQRWILLAAAVVLASRGFFIPETLEDIDSVNFALALEEFDPRLHQPHPPGNPVYVALAKLVHAAVPQPAPALALLSAAAQAALVVPLVALLQSLARERAVVVSAAVLTLANPILWFNGARPLSDSVGLFFILAAQALILQACVKEERRGAALVAGSFLAGLSMGVRLQAGLLTLPLWLYALFRSPTSRAGASAALLAGVGLWAFPLVRESGGGSSYVEAFAGTLDDALPVEPLVSRFTLNRAARTLVRGVIGPWVSPPLGIGLTLLAGVGFLLLLRRRRPSLGLGILVFGPYLVLHFLFQHVEALRHSLPYIPFIAWLAAEAIAAAVGLAPVRAREHLRGAAIVVLGLVSASLTLPALATYHLQPSPPYAALRALEAVSPPGSYVLSGHYMFNRYLHLRPKGLELIEPAPRQELARLKAYWKSGGRKTVLFLSHPDRTDLEMVAPSARRLLGRWEWGFDSDRFIPGARPNRVELIAVERPAWFAGEGWMISNEAGSVDEVTRVSERKAWLGPISGPAFILLSGDPLAPESSRFLMDVKISGESIDRHPLGSPVLRGYLLDNPAAKAAPGSSDYLPLTVETRRDGSLAGAPFLLKGLEFGERRRAAFVHAEGWFLPERDEKLFLLRWVSPRARTLLHVPREGARLGIEGRAPVEYVGPGVRIEVRVEGGSGATALIKDVEDGAFRLDLEIPEQGKPFQELLLLTDRSFVPDDFQKNGDRRRLALRIYRFQLRSRSEPEADSGPGLDLRGDQVNRDLERP